MHERAITCGVAYVCVRVQVSVCECMRACMCVLTCNFMCVCAIGMEAWNGDYSMRFQMPRRLSAAALSCLNLVLAQCTFAQMETQVVVALFCETLPLCACF